MKIKSATLTILIIFFISNQLLSQINESAKKWIIIANNTKTYIDKACKEFSPNMFQYKDEVIGNLIEINDPTIRYSIVEIYFNNDTIYLPFPMLVEKISIEDFKLQSIGHEKIDIKTPIPFEYAPVDLVTLDQKWNYHNESYPKYLRKEVADALLKMLNYAADQGIHFRVVSAYRSIRKQRSLYIRAIQKKGIYQVGTAKPAHSEHHLGTTIDLTSTNRKDVLSVSFDKTKEGKWLQDHAHKFGFIQSYTKNNIKESGYMAEPWHFRFVGVKTQ